MNHLHQDIDSRLGALELGALVFRSDAALEAASAASPHPSNLNYPFCTHVEDAELEATSLELQPQTFPRSVCFHIDDAALETAAALEAQPQTRRIFPNNPGCI